MSKPIIHAKSSVRKWGGIVEDYLPIHNFMDSSKSTFSDNRHRALTHNSWFIGPDGPLERAFGAEIINNDGRAIPTRDIGEQHVAEDFGGYIPTVQDYLGNMAYCDWMGANGMPGKLPPSAAKTRVKLRKEDTPAAKKIWEDVDKAASKAPDWIKTKSAYDWGTFTISPTIIDG